MSVMLLGTGHYFLLGGEQSQKSVENILRFKEQASENEPLWALEKFPPKAQEIGPPFGKKIPPPLWPIKKFCPHPFVP